MSNPPLSESQSSPQSSFIARAESLATRLADALLPQHCFLCGRPSARSPVCRGCDESLPRLRDPRCPVCALPTAEAGVCGGCLKEPPHFDATQAVFDYAYPADALVLALKYRGRLPLARWLGKRLAERSRPDADLLVALPLHPTRLAERGFNQAMEIARPLTRAWGIPLERGACERIVHGAPQAGLPFAERRRNVRGAFLVNRPLTGRAVAVVDDVMTTGATLNEFARALKKAGASRVVNCVVCRTPLD